MTEEIIIGGVNVAGCEFLRNCIIPDNYGCKIDDSLCCDVGNCYYKQLKRLEQKYNEVLKLAKQNADSNEYVIQELEKENEELKEKIKVLQYNIAEYSNNNIDTAVTLFAKDKAKLEEENALLKAYKSKYYQQTLDDEIQINELYQTLQEIKEIAETCMNKDGCFECKYSDDCYIEDTEIPIYDICKLLIQKIIKAEEE